MRQLIFDVETQKTFDEVGGYFPEKLGISFIGAIERVGFPEDSDSTELRHCFFEDDLNKFWPILESADVVIGFNSNGFDLVTLKPYYSGDVTSLPSLDLLDVVRSSIGHRLSLDAIAAQTLGTQKTGHGLDAIKYYRDKEWKKLASYCMKDVEITRDLYDFGRVNGKIKYLDRRSNLAEAAVDFTFTPKAAPPATQMSLV